MYNFSKTLIFDKRPMSPLPTGPSHALHCTCGVDVHAHVVPDAFPAYLGHKVPSPWPSMAAAPAQQGRCHQHIVVAGKNYRTVSDACWSASRRLSDFAAMGVSHQLVSPMPELLSYWLDLEDAAPLLRFLNEFTAQLCSESQGKLLGMAAVPLQDTAAAIAELQHARALGLVGVEIGSNILGRPIASVEYDAFFEACCALDMPVFVHALKPTGMDRLSGPSQLEQVLAYPTDVGLAAAAVITGGLLQRFPTLRIAFSHGGGTLASLLPRLQQGWQVFPALAEKIPEAPVDQARKMFYDTLVFDAATLQHLKATLGLGQLLLGTDYPFNFREKAPLKRLQDIGWTTAEIETVAIANARRFIGRSLF